MVASTAKQALRFPFAPPDQLKPRSEPVRFNFDAYSPFFCHLERRSVLLVGVYFPSLTLDGNDS